MPINPAVIRDVMPDQPQHGDEVYQIPLPVGYGKGAASTRYAEPDLFSEFCAKAKPYMTICTHRAHRGWRALRARKLRQDCNKGAIKQDIPTLFTGSTEPRPSMYMATSPCAWRHFNRTRHLRRHPCLADINDDHRRCLRRPALARTTTISFGYGGYWRLQGRKRSSPTTVKCHRTDQSHCRSNTTRKDFIADEILKSKPRSSAFRPDDHESRLGQLPCLVRGAS